LITGPSLAVGSPCFSRTVVFRHIRCFRPKPVINLWEKKMARRAEATLWMLIKQGDKSRYVSVSKVGNGRYVTNAEGSFEPGPFGHLGRYVFSIDSGSL